MSDLTDKTIPRDVAVPDAPTPGRSTGRPTRALATASCWFSQVAFGAIAAGVVAAAMLASAGQLGAGPTIPGDKAEADQGPMPTFPAAATDLQSSGQSASSGSGASPPSGTLKAGQEFVAAPPVSLPSPAVSPFPPVQPTSVETSMPMTPAMPDVSAAPPNVTLPITEPDRGGTPGLKPAKVLFGAVKTAAPLAARAIGSYAKGCLSGAKAMPVDGPHWQAMRLSRNRNWGHPRLIAMLQRLAKDGREKDSWPGLLVGDLSQPRGGPMLTGHASHQIGLDADVWLTPMPDRRLSEAERETMSATSMLADDAVTVARDKWTDGHLKIIKRAATYPEVERVLVHPAIKQVLCFAAKDDRSWLSKVRPYWGHHYHFHIRIGCPAGSTNCVSQAPPPGDDGCGSELDDWLKRVGNAAAAALQPIPVPPSKPVKVPPPITLDRLPEECRVVLATGNPSATADVAAAAAAAATAQQAASRDRNKTAGKQQPAVATVTTATDPGATPSAARPVPSVPGVATTQVTKPSAAASPVVPGEAAK